MAQRKTHRKYSDSEKAEALAVLDSNNGNKKKTAAELKIPRTNLIEWEQGNGISVDVPKLRQGKKLELADRIEAVVWQIVDAMPSKIDKAGLKDAAISMGTGIDKAQLLRGDPTSITASYNDRKAELLVLLQGVADRARDSIGNVAVGLIAMLPTADDETRAIFREIVAESAASEPPLVVEGEQ